MWYKILGGAAVLLAILVVAIVILFMTRKSNGKKHKFADCLNGRCVKNPLGSMLLSQCQKTCGKAPPPAGAPDLPSNITPGAGSGDVKSILNQVQGKIYKDTTLGGYVTYMPKNMTNIGSEGTNPLNRDNGNTAVCRDKNGTVSQCPNYKNIHKGSKNHGSALAILPNGTTVATWFSGLCEGYAKVTIQYSLLAPGSLQWTGQPGGGSIAVPHNQIWDRSNQNSVLHYDTSAGLLKLLFPSQPCNCTCDGLMPNEAYAVVYEQDYKAGNWSDKKAILTAYSDPKSTVPDCNKGGCGVFIKNKVVQFSADKWWIPGYLFPQHKAVDEDQTPVNWQTVDGGKTYTMQNIGSMAKNAGGRVQPSIFSFNGKYYAFMRDREKKVIWYSTYKGDGTWANLQQTDIPNNDSGIQGMTAADGSLLLALNPLAGDHRNELAIWRCPPGGKLLEKKSYKKFTIEKSSRKDRDFSYPWIIEDSNGGVQISYTLRQQHSGGNNANQREDGWFIMWRMFPADVVKQKLY